MNMEKQQYLWLDDKFVKFADANVHVLTHSLQYGSGIFEGIRCYKTAKGPAIFRLQDHFKRFYRSIKIYGMPVKPTSDKLESATKSLISKNGLESAYVRPFAFYNHVGIGFTTKGKSASVAIAAVPYDSLYKDAENGIRCRVSSWMRINSSILPPGAKASGNYLNSIIASQEAKNSGYDEAIFMTTDGYICEGPGENIFMVKDGVLITPPDYADILLGITRDSVIKIAEKAGIALQQRPIRREELYTADEVFFSGTAAEITPVISVDSRHVGSGAVGKLTSEIRTKYHKIVTGNDKAFSYWLTFIRS
jgi:branched-chain amino acid aminotransferase